MAQAKKPRGRAAAKSETPVALFPQGMHIEDTCKKIWIFGNKLGSGGCGVVYEGSSGTNPSASNFVIKVEYHEKGPLFAEMHAYLSIGKPEKIAQFKKKKGINFLGIPPCHGSGSFMHSGVKYRFIVIPKYGKDIQHIIKENSSVLHPKTVFTIGSIVINALEYIHSFGYVHGDIKAENLLLGPDKASINDVYVLDLGIATRYKSKDGKHKSNNPDPKKSDNGTAEFISRDGHSGVFCRRSDLEVLGYNMLLWLSGSLPWIKFIKDLGKVKSEKNRYMSNIPLLMQDVFGNNIYPELEEYMLYVSRLGFEEEPNYGQCITFFKQALNRLNLNDDGILILKESKKNVVEELSTGPSSSQKENKGKKAENKKRIKDVSTNATLPTGEVLTPAMLAVLNRQQERAIEKAAKKPRKKAD